MRESRAQGSRDIWAGLLVFPEPVLVKRLKGNKMVHRWREVVGKVELSLYYSCWTLCPSGLLFTCDTLSGLF